MIYYSQIEQDKYFIENISKGKRDGVFLDIGANDGLFGSNTATLEFEYGWTGLCIEANPTITQALKTNRPKSIVVNKAVWTGPGQISIEVPNHFKEDEPPDQLGRVAGLQRNAKYFKKYFDQGYKTYQVEADTATSIINQTLGIPIVIDYMSLDTEGAEIEALESIDFNLVDIKFMTIEHGNREGYESIFENYLKRFGYRVHRINRWDIEFTK